METQLHLKFWKSKALALIIFFCLFNPIEGKCQSGLKIDKEKVRLDIIDNNEYLFPEEFIKNLDVNLFNENYLNDLCIVHISYKNRSTYCTDKFSLVLVYRYINDSWIFRNSFPYYYKLRLLDSNIKLFVSENKICGMDGECNTYIEISKFDGNELIQLKFFVGYNKELFYDRLLVLEKYSDVKKAIGDTIVRDVKIVDFKLNSDSLNFCTVEQTVLILEDYRNNLITKEIKTTKQIIF